jgi:hypothetical protein
MTDSGIASVLAHPVTLRNRRVSERWSGSSTVTLTNGSAEILRFPQNDGMGSSEPIPQSVTLRNRRVSRAGVGESDRHTHQRSCERGARYRHKKTHLRYRTASMASGPAHTRRARCPRPNKPSNQQTIRQAISPEANLQSPISNSPINQPAPTTAPSRYPTHPTTPDSAGRRSG